MIKALPIAILTLINTLTLFGQENYLEKGNSYLNEGDFERAEKVFREGIEADPKDKILQCQLGLTLIQEGKYDDAGLILTKVLENEPNNIGANWYAGIGNFKNAKDKKAIEYFEKVLPLLNKTSGQYYSAHWFIGTCYRNLLMTEGLTYTETDRMFECFEEYMKLQPNAKDSQEIKEYVDRKKKRRPSKNVEKWLDL